MFMLDDYLRPCVTCCCCIVSALHRYSPMKLSVAFIANELAFSDSAECIQFLMPLGVILMSDGSHVDCKQSLTAVLAQ